MPFAPACTTGEPLSPNGVQSPGHPEPSHPEPSHPEPRAPTSPGLPPSPDLLTDEDHGTLDLAAMRKLASSQGFERFWTRTVPERRWSRGELWAAFLDEGSENKITKIQAEAISRQLENEEWSSEVTDYLICAAIRQFLRKRPQLEHVSTFQDVVDLIRSSNRILLLTGAGISVSCGIPDFRSENGLYSLVKQRFPEMNDPTLMFDLNYLRLAPEVFYSFAKEIYPAAHEPSVTHRFLRKVELEGRLLRVYTQNIDGLEKKAGVESVVQCHGSFDSAYCLRCKKVVPGQDIEEELLAGSIAYCEDCHRSPMVEDPVMKPGIVFFGENLPKEFDDKVDVDRNLCDLVLVIGSSLKVAPVSDIIHAIPHKVPQILINREPIRHLPNHFDVQLLGESDVVIQELARRLGWSLGNGDETGDETLLEPEQLPEADGTPRGIYLFQGHRFQGLYLSDDSASEDGKGNEAADEGLPAEGESDSEDDQAMKDFVSSMHAGDHTEGNGRGRAASSHSDDSSGPPLAQNIRESEARGPVQRLSTTLTEDDRKRYDALFASMSSHDARKSRGEQSMMMPTSTPATHANAPEITEEDKARYAALFSNRQEDECRVPDFVDKFDEEFTGADFYEQDDQTEDDNDSAEEDSGRYGEASSSAAVAGPSTQSYRRVGDPAEDGESDSEDDKAFRHFEDFRLGRKPSPVSGAVPSGSSKGKGKRLADSPSDDTEILRKMLKPSRV